MPPIARANPRTSQLPMRMQPVPVPIPAETSGDQRAIPFDYTFRFDLTGERDRTHRGVVTISVEAEFTAVSIGYGVAPRVTPVIFGPPLQFPVIDEGTPSLSLRNVTIGSLLDALNAALAQTPDVIRGETGPESVLKGGIRLNPQFAEIALVDGGLNSITDEGISRRLFQVVSAPSDEIQFLYALFDEGSGREFQSEPLLNTAGLGISNGDRPFRYFARPITFAPRSTIRLEITEKSDFQGELHVSLHGYKVLGGPGTPTASAPAGRRRSR
jgi:hypothetical protein